MKPVMQTRTGNSVDGPGNCFSACVAALLECSLEDLPDEAAIVRQLKQEFAEKWDTWPDRFKRGKSWTRLWNDTQEYLLRKGFYLVEVRGPFLGEMPDGWTILSGKSPRGILHCCVGWGTHQLKHDPHPEGSGLTDEERTVLFFVSVDPAKHLSCP